MSLDKAIASVKEHRKPYYGIKAIDKGCCNHGSCKWCRENRLHKFYINGMEWKELRGRFLFLCD